MADLLTDIEALESGIEAILDRMDRRIQSRNRQQLQEALLDAILEALAGVNLGDLAGQGDLAELIGDAIEQLGEAFVEAIYDRIADTAGEAIGRTQLFYDALGVTPPGVREAVRTSERTQKLVAHLDAGMTAISDRLRTGTLDAITQQIATGRTDREALAEAIESTTTASARHAATQAGTSVSAYNQLYRAELATAAELDHWLYYGALKDGSRIFCQYCAGRVYTTAQLAAMDNGQLDPVETFKGGWNCRHSLLPLDLAWDDSLRTRFVDTDLVDVDISDTRRIRVYDRPL